MSSGSTLTQTDFNLMSYLDLSAQLRHAKSKHVIYTNFPDLRQMDCLVYWGVFSWSVPSQKRRYLKRNGIVSTTKLASTAGDIVRDYLDFYHPKKLRAIRAEATIYDRLQSAPLYVNPTIIRDAMYVDITSTYWSIVNLVGWNVSYLPGAWLIPGRAPLDFPLPNHKPARNYLVSAGLPGQITIWTGKRMVFKPVRNVHINTGLWSVVQGVLSSIARIAVSLGAVYVHTDGYILPAAKAEALCEHIKTWGLEPRIIAEGTAYVVGFGNYTIGTKTTKRFEPERVQTHFSNLPIQTDKRLRSMVSEIRKRGTPSRLYEQSVRW